MDALIFQDVNIHRMQIEIKWMINDGFRQKGKWLKGEKIFYYFRDY